MSSIQPLGDAPSTAEELLVLRDRIDDLDRRLADLSRDVACRPPGESNPPGTATSDAPAESGWTLLFHRIDRLARRLDRDERREAGVVDRVDGHDEILRKMRIALERLDDPYGMGTSLDEWIGVEDASPESDEEGQTS